MKKQKVQRWLRVFLIVMTLLVLSACSAQQGTAPSTAVAEIIPTETIAATATDAVTATAEATATDAATATRAASPTPAATDTPTATPTPKISPTSSMTATPAPTNTASASPTPSATPTRNYPNVTVNQQANCRYGPGTAYLYRWGLYDGDTAEVHGRNWNGTWYWIKPFNLDSHCWASEIVFDVEEGDPKSVPYVERRLPKTTFAGPPGNVQAVRNGNEVTVSWDVVPLSDDKRRGYMIEANICQNGAYFPIVIQTDNTSYTFTDEGGCPTPSNGLLYTAEKHGYSDPVNIAWPGG